MVEPNMEGEQLEGQDDEAKRAEDVPPVAEGGSRGFVGVPFPSSTGSPPSKPRCDCFLWHEPGCPYYSVKWVRL